MKLLCDENIEVQTVALLRSSGWEVLHITELSPGVTDEVVLARAEQENALLLTLDKDFGELVVRLRKVSNGVLLIRLPELNVLERASQILECLERHGPELFGAFSVLSDLALRIRPINPES